jgi:hypothetical protein
MSKKGSNIMKMSDLEDHDHRYMSAVLVAVGALITLLVVGSLYRMVEFFLIIG